MKMPPKLDIVHGKGTLLKIDTFQFQCYILNNNQRIFSIDDASKSFGYTGKSENWLAEFLEHLSRLTTVEPETLKAVLSPYSFLEQHSNNSSIIRQGISSSVFLEWCKAVVKAKNDGYLFLSELKYAKVAESILAANALCNLNDLIDYSTGYILYKQNLKDSLYRFMIQKYRADFFVWIKAFPDEFFNQVFKMKKWDWINLNRNPEETANFINNLTFARLSAPLLEELITSKPRMKYRKPNKPEMYVLHPQLLQHITAVMSLIKAVGEDEDIFNQLLDQVYPLANKLLFFTGTDKKIPQNDQLISVTDNLKRLLNL